MSSGTEDIEFESSRYTDHRCSNCYRSLSKRTARMYRGKNACPFCEEYEDDE